LIARRCRRVVVAYFFLLFFFLKDGCLLGYFA